MPEGEVCHPLFVTDEHAMVQRDQRAQSPLGRRLQCTLQIGVGTADFHGLKGYLEPSRRHLVLCQHTFPPWFVRIPKEACAGTSRPDRREPFQPIST